MYDQTYLGKVGEIMSNEGELSPEQFEKIARSWLPTKRDPKTKELLFPLPEDWERVRASYDKFMGR